jgi:hypothetical protein
MAITLAMTLVELSDSSAVRITDTTADYDPGDIQAVFDTGTATITPVIEGVAYDAIDVVSYFDGDSQANLIFDITPVMLEIGSVAQFVSGDLMPDGDYQITYAVDTGVGESDSLTESWLVYGVIEKGVLDQLRVTDINVLTFEENLRKAMIRLAHYAYMQSMVQSAYVSEIENLRTILATLENMVENGIY